MSLAVRFSSLSYVLALLILPIAVLAQGQPQLLADLNTNLTAYNCSSTVNKGLTQTAVSLGKSFFACSSAEFGSELWVSDGSAAGTRLVKDINPGVTSSLPSFITAVNGGLTPLVFFIANGPDTGVELWRSDGTEAGTTLVADVAPGVTSSVPRILGTFADQAVIFSADMSVTGRELYFADRTTFRSLGDLYPGQFAGISINSTGVYLPSNGYFYFAGADPVNGTELFRTDGVSISIWANIRAGSASSQPANFTLSPLDNAVYFSANNGVNGTEFWSTTGVTTVQVSDLNPGATSSNPSNFVVTRPATAADRRVVFSATTAADGDRLFAFNPTTNGFSTVAQVVPGAVGDKIGIVIASGTNVFFQAIAAATGKELYAYNTLTGAINLTADFAPGAASSVLSDFAPIGDSSLLVKAYNPLSTDEELYITNGGSSSLALLRDLNPGPLGSASVYLGGTNSYKIFQALSGNDTNMWRTDGTTGGTFAFKDLSVPGGTKSSTPFYKMIIGDRLIHDASSSSVGSEPQALNLSTNENVILKDIAPGNSQNSFPGPFQQFGSKAVFSAVSYTFGYEPFITDGTPGGTELLGDFCSDQNQLQAPYILVVNDKIVVLSPDAAALYGYSVFVSSGTPGVFTKVFGPGGIYPALSASASQPVAIGNNVFLSAGDASTGAELYKLDLTNNSATLLADFYTADQSGSPGSMTVIDGKVYMAATVATPVGREFAVSDGTPGGTFLLADVEPSPGSSSSPQDFVKLGSKVVFLATTLAAGRELFISDGTPGNATLIADVNPGAVSSLTTLIDKSVVLGNVLYFAASDTEHGQELWRTDGTAAGTYMVKDINPGQLSSSPSYLVEVDGYIYFAAVNSAFGSELWRSDGTDAGTIMLQDVAPGPISATPQRPLVVGGTLILGMNNGATGNELFRWTVDECLGSGKFSPGVCGCGTQDLDLNANGIFDCKQGAELKAILDRVNQNIRTLSNKRLKASKRKATLRLLRTNTSAALAYGTAGAGAISVASVKPLTVLLGALNKKVKGLTKSFSTKNLSAAKKAFNSLNGAIVA